MQCRRRLCCAALLAALAAAPLVAARAQSVALTGLMGDRALLVIDGEAPVVLARGQTRQGVTLVSVGADSAVLDIGGQQETLRVGESPVRLGGKASGTRVVLAAGSGGHYFGIAQINGVSANFVVDTGASNVVMSTAQADQLGLDYRAGQRETVATANGVTLAYGIGLDSVRVGSVEVYNVHATVVPTSATVILLGNSFLAHFQMTQENGELVLEKRY